MYYKDKGFSKLSNIIIDKEKLNPSKHIIHILILIATLTGISLLRSHCSYLGLRPMAGDNTLLSSAYILSKTNQYTFRGIPEFAVSV